MIGNVGEGDTLQAVLDRIDGDAQLLVEIIDAFLKECPVSLARLRQSLDNRDADGTAFHAHALLGALRVLDDGSAVALAHELEVLAEGQNFLEGGRVLAQLTSALEVLRGRLLAWRATGSE